MPAVSRPRHRVLLALLAGLTTLATTQAQAETKLRVVLNWKYPEIKQIGLGAVEAASLSRARKLEEIFTPAFLPPADQRLKALF